MTGADTQQTDGTSTVEKGLGVLDRAWDASWALRLICLVLFLDIAMIRHSNRGLWQWSEADKVLLGDVGWIALTLVGFSVAVAIVMPVAVRVLRLLILLIWDWLPAFPTAADNRRYERRIGYVPARKFRDLALREKDEFLFRLYQAHQQQKHADELSRERAGDLTAAAFLVALADWLITLWMPESVSVIEALYRALGDWAFVVLIVVLLCAGAILKHAWFADTPPNEIYYPPLDDELRAQERKNGEMY